jgi:hypothetical protein
VKTNTNAYIANFQAYAMECITTELGDAFPSLIDALTYAIERYSSEFCCPYHNALYPNRQQRLAEYLRGLPFGFDFSNHDIAEAYARLHGERCKAEKELAIVNMWFDHLSLMLERVSNKSGLSFHK